jgi:hypothetical protein
METTPIKFLSVNCFLDIVNTLKKKKQRVIAVLCFIECTIVKDIHLHALDGEKLRLRQEAEIALKKIALKPRQLKGNSASTLGLL